MPLMAAKRKDKSKFIGWAVCLHARVTLKEIDGHVRIVCQDCGTVRT